MPVPLFSQCLFLPALCNLDTRCYLTGDGMGPSSNHNGNTMNMGGTGLIDDGGSRPEVQYEDADYNSMPADEHGRRTIPSGLMDDGSHNPSLFSNDDQGGTLHLDALNMCDNWMLSIRCVELLPRIKRSLKTFIEG